MSLSGNKELRTKFTNSVSDKLKVDVVEIKKKSKSWSWRRIPWISKFVNYKEMSETNVETGNSIKMWEYQVHLDSVHERAECWKMNWKMI